MAGGALGWVTLEDRSPQGTNDHADSPRRGTQVRDTLPGRDKGRLFLPSPESLSTFPFSGLGA